MMKKILFALMMMVSVFCLAFGFAACGETENSGNTGGSQTEQPGGSQSGNQGNQGGGTQKPNEGQGGGTSKPDDDPGGSQEKPEEPPAKETDFTFTQSGNGFSVTAYSGEAKRVVVPAEHDGKPVTAIASKAFYDGAFTSITLPASLKEIGESAFGYCTKLQSIEIPNCARIGDSAFIGCATLQEITLPQDAILLGSSLFQYCNALKKVTINGGTVQNTTFSGAEMLTEIVLGKGVTSVAQGTFSACRNLKVLTMPRVETGESFMSYYFNVTPEIYTLKKTETIVSELPDDIIPDAIDAYRVGNRVFGLPRNNTTWSYYGNSITVDGKTYIYSGKPITVLKWKSCYDVTVNVSYSVPEQWTAEFYHYPETSLEKLTITEQQISIYDKTFDDCACEIDILKKFPVKSLNITGTTECFIDELLPENYVLYIEREDGFKETYPLFDYISEQDKSALQKAGTHKLTVTYEGETCSITITVKLHTFDNAKLDSKEFYFDGSSHSLEVTGVPEGTQITYQNNGKSEAGEYTVTATLTKQYYETKTLTATLSIIPSFYEIHYVLGLDGVTNENPASYKTDGEDIKLKDPVRSGYEFLGWYTEAGFQNKITEIKGNARKRYTLYAKWQSVFTLSGGTITGLTAYGKKQTELIIDETINGTKITSIGEKAFYDNTKLQKITIPASITSIGDYAFSSCSGLKGELKIPDSVTSIGDYAFEGCSGLTGELKIPDNVISIGERAFDGCKQIIQEENNVSYVDRWVIGCSSSAIQITMRVDTKGIADSAFSGCSKIDSVTIPDSVTLIGDSVFKNCSNLRSVIWNAENCTKAGSYSYPIFKDCTKLSSVTFGSNVQSIPAYAFYKCNGLTGNLEIPVSVTSIGYYAFEYCSGLTSVTIGSGVTSIGDSAFKYCSGLTSVTIGSGVTSIGDYAFEGCSSLQSIEIPDSVTSIGDYAFCGCSGLISVIWNAENCTYVGVVAPTFINLIFTDCTKLNTVIIGENVKTIPAYAFCGCSGLTGILKIPDSVTSIGNDAFSDCNGLTSVSIGSGVTSIGKWAFSGCSGLTGNLKIPDSVTSIGYEAFYGCSGLTSVTIGSGVTEIGDEAFISCSGLKKVHISDLAAWCGITFSDYDANPLYYVHHLYLDDVEVKNLTISSDIKEIKAFAFSGCSGLESVTIESGSIGNQAFYYCSGLKSVTIESGSIGWSAFSGCSGLKSVTIGNGVTSIGDEAFRYCSGLTEIKVDTNNPIYHAGGNCLIETKSKTLIVGCKTSKISEDGSVTLIGDYAFSDCSGLTNIVIPDSVISIGRDSFYNCSGLTSITIGSGVTSIGVDAFHHCSGLTEIKVDTNNPIYHTDRNCLIETKSKTLIIGCKTSKIPDDGSVTSIAPGAFRYRCGLTSIEIPDSVTSIGSYAFGDCSGLTSVTIGSGVTSIGGSAFEHCYKLIEVWNHSTLPIVCGNSSYGSVAYYARAVYQANEPSRQTVKDGYLFYEDGEVSCLFGYIGEDTDLTLPVLSPSGKNYVINQYAFSGCSGLTSIEIPDGVTSIGRDAFQYCSLLTSVNIPDSVTSIGEYAFEYCSGLTKIQYNGTIDAWKQIRKGTLWNIGTGNYTVYCTDGTITKDGKETYYNNAQSVSAYVAATPRKREF